MSSKAACKICNLELTIPDNDKEILQHEDQVKKLLEHQKRCEGKFSHLDIQEVFVGLEEHDYHD